MQDSDKKSAESTTDLEIDITDYRGLSTGCYHSTDDLLISEIRTEGEEGATSGCETTSISACTISKSRESSTSPQPIILRFDLAEPRDTAPSQSAHSDPEPQLNVTNNVSHDWSCSHSEANIECIELEPWTFQTGGAAKSTERLVPLPPDESMVADSPQSKEKAIDSSLALEREATAGPVPNYKPLVLRWHFQVLLIGLIAAMVAFLEYEVHALPPVDFSILDMQHPDPKRVVDDSPTIRTAETRPLPKSAWSPPAVTAAPSVSSNGPDRIGQALTMAPQRVARPPESLYPNTNLLITAYCGWGSVQWRSLKISALQVEALIETIPIFTTTDPSWCPCTVDKWVRWDYKYRPGDPGGMIREGSLNGPRWETNDEDCESVMNAISSFNNRKIMLWPSTGDGPDIWGDYVTTPPSDPTAQPLWIFPTTNDQGDILFPLEVRTAWGVETMEREVPGGREHQDVFGSNVDDRQTGHFPATFCCDDAHHTLDSHEALASAACDVARTQNFERWQNGGPGAFYPEFRPTLVECPRTTKYPTTWWTLPRRRPSTTLGVTSATSTTLLPTSVPGETTTTAASPSTPTRSDDLAADHSTAPASQTLSSQSSGPQHSAPNSSSRSIINHSITVGTGNGAFTEMKPSSTAPEGSASTVAPSPRPPSIGRDGSTGEQPKATDAISTGALVFVNSTDKGHDPQTKEPGQSVQTNLENINLSQSRDSTSASPTTRASDIRWVFNGAGFFVTGDVNLVLLSAGIPVLVTEVPGLSSLGPGTFAASIDAPTGPTQVITVSHVVVTLLLSPKTITSQLPYNTIRPSLPFNPSRPYLPGPGAGPIPPQAHGDFFNLRSETDYLKASLIPVLLATLLSVPIQIFVATVAAILPFRALASHKPGAASEDSVCLSQRTWRASMVALRFLRRARDPLPLLAVILGALSTILIPLSTETIRLDYTGINCPQFRQKQCGFGLRTSGQPLRVAESLLVAMAVLVIWMGLIFGRGKRRTGLASEPWSIASMASFLAHPEFRELLRSALFVSGGDSPDETHVKKTLEGKTFRLAYHYRERNDQPIYAIEVLQALEDASPVKPTTQDPPLRKPIPPSRPSPKRTFWQPRLANAELLIRAIALVFIMGLLILILYYENTIADTPFEGFMNSQSFGVRLLFTSFGTAVSGFWDWYFFQISESQIHNRLSKSPQPAKSSILLSPPQNIFTGLYTFFRSRDIFALNVAFTTLLAKFTPILFSNIPFRNTVTWRMHESCTWLAAAVLGYMVLVLVATFFGPGFLAGKLSRVSKKMPVKTDTILGCMYYLVESDMVKDFEGLAGLGRKERGRLVGEMGRHYTFSAGNLQRGKVDYDMGSRTKSATGRGVDG